MAVSVADVKTLREKTGAGMMDCKKALQEAGGDFDRAEKILKEQGLAAAAKRSGRAANEGRVFTRVTETGAAILELASETDFVARNKEFIALGEHLLDSILGDALDEPTPGLTEEITQAIGIIKENIELRRFRRYDGGNGTLLVDYVHGEGAIGVVLRFELSAADLATNAAVKETTFDLALHAAAYAPTYLTREQVDQAYLNEQEGIFRKQAENLGKPEKVVEGITKGKLRKHLEEITFLDQAFVKDPKRSVSAVLKDLGKDVSGTVDLTDYTYYKVGQE